MNQSKKKHASQRTIQCEGAYGKLDETVRNYAPKIDENMIPRFTPRLREGQSFMPPSQFLGLSMLELGELVEIVTESDKDRIEASIARAFARKGLLKMNQALNRRMRHIAFAVEGAYGEIGRLAVPYRHADTRNFGAIQNQAETMEGQLLAFALPQPAGDATSSGVAIMPPPEVLAASLRSRIDEFKEARSAYIATIRNIVAIKARHEAALEAFNEQERRVRGLMKSFLHLAGLEELATVLRLDRRGTHANDQGGDDQGGDDQNNEPAFSGVSV